MRATYHHKGKELCLGQSSSWVEAYIMRRWAAEVLGVVDDHAARHDRSSTPSTASAATPPLRLARGKEDPRLLAYILALVRSGVRQCQASVRPRHRDLYPANISLPKITEMPHPRPRGAFATRAARAFQTTYMSNPTHLTLYDAIPTTTPNSGTVPKKLSTKRKRPLIKHTHPRFEAHAV